MQGIMALPEAQEPMGMAPEQSAIFEQIRQNVPRPEITQELLSAGEQADPQAVAEFKQELAGLQLTPDELGKLNMMVDAILASPQDYASLRRAYLAEGISEDLLPEQFDPAFFAALNMALDTIAMNPAPRPPMQMAMGGVADLAAYGRNGDTMLAHITPQEAAMLKRMGGSGTINPYTGLPEYGNIFKSIGKAVKKFAKSTVGKVIIGAGLAIFGGPAAAAFLSSMAGGTATVLGGFLSSTAGSAAVGGFLAGAGTTLAAGGNLKQALKAGAIGGLSGAALAGVTQGMDAFAARSELVNPADLAGQVSGGGLGEPGVTVNRGVGTAADFVKAPSLDAARIPMGDNLYSPIDQAQNVINDYRASIGEIDPTSLNRGYPIGSTTAGRQAVLNEALAKDSLVGRFAAPGTGDLGQFIGGEMPANTGSLTPVDRAIPSAQNTGAGTYDLTGKFTQAPSNTGAVFDSNQPYPKAQIGKGGVMDTLRSGFDKTVDFFNPNTVGAEAQARAMQAGDAARDAAFKSSYSKSLLSLGKDAVEAFAEDKLPRALRETLTSTAFDAGQAAYDAAYKAALPGTFARYAPLAAAGLGVMALGGGFKQEKPQMPDIFKGPTGFDLLRQYPNRYGLQFGGINPTAYGNMYLQPPGYAMGGGVMDTPQAMRIGGKTYPRKTGPIDGPGTGTSDSIPAMLSDGEFVFTAKAVRAMGNGSRRKGAKKMYKLMKMLEGKAA